MQQQDAFMPLMAARYLRCFLANLDIQKSQPAEIDDSTFCHLAGPGSRAWSIHTADSA